MTPLENSPDPLPDPPRDGRRGPLHRLLREPLLQFALLGALLFFASTWLQGRRHAADQRIVIDPALVTHQRNLYQVQFGAEPDDATLAALLERHVRDEALYREGRRLGLDTEDEVIRQRVIQKMETLLTDAEPVPEPDETALRAFHAAHADRYGDLPVVTFAQLYFSDDTGRAPNARQRAATALAALRAGATVARVAAEPFALGDVHTRLDAQELRRRFGDKPLADGVLAAPLAQWVGPFESGYGWHLVRVTAREPGGPQPFEAVRDEVHLHLLEDLRQRAMQRRIAALVQQYEVRRETLPAAAPAPMPREPAR